MDEPTLPLNKADREVIMLALSEWILFTHAIAFDPDEAEQHREGEEAARPAARGSAAEDDRPIRILIDRLPLQEEVCDECQSARSEHARKKSFS